MVKPPTHQVLAVKQEPGGTSGTNEHMVRALVGPLTLSNLMNASPLLKGSSPGHCSSIQYPFPVHSSVSCFNT